MNIETIIALITAGIAFLTSAASLIYNVIQSKKDRVQRVILENRVKYMDEIRDGFSAIIGLANETVITLAKTESSILKTYTEKLLYGYGKLKTLIKPFYEIDKELLISLESLYETILSALAGDTDAVKQINCLRDDFSDKYLKYDWAYWKYIQSQKDGNYVNSDDAFDKMYYDFVEKVNKHSL